MHSPLTLPALGTTWWIEIADTNTPRDHIYTEITRCIHTFEKTFSRFNSDSPLSILNRERVLHHPTPAFIEVLSYGVHAFHKTNGVFNILVGEALTARGYDSSYSFVAAPTANNIVAPDPTVAITITTDNITLHDGTIDLGGFGKGYLIDSIANVLRQFGCASFLINGGGDLYATRDGDVPYSIHLEHPTLTDTYLGTTTLENQGFAASSPHKRSWKHNDVTYSHIITPHSDGHIADASFIRAATAAEADILATCALMLSPKDLFPIVAQHNASGAIYTAATNSFLRFGGFNFTPL